NPDDDRWIEVGQACVKNQLSGRNVEAIANNIRSHIQDFEYPDEYFQASLERRREIIDQLSKRVSVDEIVERINKYSEFQIEAEEKAARDRFEREVEEMVRQLNAGRAATERAAKAIEATLAPRDQS